MKKIFGSMALLLSLVMFAPISLQAQTTDKPAEMSSANTKVNINTADASTLALALDGVGMAKAQDIVAYREKNGDFKSVEQLAEVKGIGAATIARNRDKVIVATKQ